jgi:hypothetical protein
MLTLMIVGLVEMKQVLKMEMLVKELHALL